MVRQAAAEAQQRGLRAHIAVTDTEGNVLGVFRMSGAGPTSRIPGTIGQGLGGLDLPASLLAITKAGSAAFLSSGSSAGGNAFSTRTAGFIVQDHFPPAIDFTPGGPLFGVQFSSLPCGDFKSPALPVGLSGDPGGLPLYKDGVLAGGVGVEGDGSYAIDTDPMSVGDPEDALTEEAAALAGTRGFEVPELIRANRILADGIRLPYLAVEMPAAAGAGAGEYVRDPLGLSPSAPRGSQPPRLVGRTVGGVNGQGDPRYPTRAGRVLTAPEVGHILDQAARQTAVTRAAIRQPLGSNTRVSIAAVDLDGAVLGFFQNEGAPNFGIDVAVQKARTVNFFSSPGAGDALVRAGMGGFVTGEVPLDGSAAYTSRAVGFLAQPFYPPGIDGTAEGPYSVPRAVWGVFNTGLQLQIVIPGILQVLGGGSAGVGCNSALLQLPNGITIFPGGIPLYKGGQLAGAIGVSGDGVDQDDLIAAAGATGFETPEERRSDRLIVRGTRLPWVKFPRHPELP